MNAGFAMVEAGMCRQKNAVNILAKNLFVFGLAVTAYWFIGFSLMYGSAFWDGILYYGKGGALGLFFDPTVCLRWSRMAASFLPLISFSRLLSQERPQQSFPDLLLSASSSVSS